MNEPITAERLLLQADWEESRGSDYLTVVFLRRAAHHGVSQPESSTDTA